VVGFCPPVHALTKKATIFHNGTVHFIIFSVIPMALPPVPFYVTAMTYTPNMVPYYLLILPATAFIPNHSWNGSVGRRSVCFSIRACNVSDEDDGMIGMLMKNDYIPIHNAIRRLQRGKR